MKMKSNIKNNFIRFLHKLAVWIISGLIIFSFALLVISIFVLIIKNQELAHIISAFLIGGFIGNIDIDSFYKVFGV